MPLSAFLRSYFSNEKKHGSRDRKCIAQLCYSYYRAGHLVKDLPVEKGILSALFLCSTEKNEILEAIEPRCNHSLQSDIDEKLALIGINKHIEDIFPFGNELSDGIDHHSFSHSLLTQPDLFIRIRPGNKKKVISKLDHAGIKYSFRQEDCLALHNTTRLDNVLAFNKEVVVQDMNSQKTLDQLTPPSEGQGEARRVWDACAGSGGKSILAKDRLGNIDLTVSDSRESILINLKKRFKESGIINYKSTVTDLTKPTARSSQLIAPSFDIIITDVPCSGSGTWGRTPEQLFYFKADQISAFAERQKTIVENCWPHLKPGGQLLYITCSVFHKENEEVIGHIKQKFHPRSTGMELLKGYNSKADTLFAALLSKGL